VGPLVRLRGLIDYNTARDHRAVDHGTTLKLATMLASGTRKSRAATCEEWDEDAQTALPGTRTSANVAAKRSKPELVPTKPHRRRTFVEGDAAKMSRTPNTRDDASVTKEKKSAGLKLDTSIPERESRLYSSGPPPERQRSTSRPSAKRQTSKAEKPDEPLIRHRPGDCWVRNCHGHHAIVPPEPQGPLKEKSIPQSPVPTSQQSSHQATSKSKRPQASTVQRRPNRSDPYGGQRPMSFHAGMLPETYHPLSAQPFAAPDWNMPPTPMLPYTHTPFAQTPTLTSLNHYQDYPQTFAVQYGQQAPAPNRPRPPEPQRGMSSRGEPIIQQPQVLMDQPSLARKASQRERRDSRDPSLSRDEDARRMPPPPQIIHASCRPSMVKASTSTSAPGSLYRERRYSSHGPGPAQAAPSERRPDPPPSSYRDRPPSAYLNSSQDRPVSQKSTSQQDPKLATRTKSSGQGLERQISLPGIERHEVEAEAYQRSQGTKSHALTVDAVTKISRHSESGSQRSVNTSSRGSSGGKTKTAAASNEITMKFNGLTLDISGNSDENHIIKIQHTRSGGVNISVSEQPSARDTTVTSLQKQSGSTTSSSRQSRRSSEKETRRSRDESADHEPHRATRTLSRSGNASFDESHGYGISYG
jgi:hypothetical protein